MQAEDWKKIKEILREALEIAEADRRRAFLDVAAPGAEIRAEVESLLAFETESEDFMSLSITDFSKDFFVTEEMSESEREAETAAKGSLVGREIGIYKIIGELGAGGMGAVYLAERADGKFARRVAVKLLRREFNTSKIRRRFEIEKEIQSKLDHPNIASLLDAGATDEGVPFLVMEYIDGLGVDVFCRENSLSLEDRLRLFNKVCDAVAFAHRNLIIHRDLKPSNILVTKDGNVKLLDFGISKLLDAQPDGGAAAATTMLGAMTPEYAAPEQIKGEKVTTAADIYALGVVLYKILTGSHPFDLSGKTNGALLEIITNNEPAPPSEPRLPNEKSSKQERGAPKLSAEIPAVSDSAAPSLPFPLSRLKGDIDNIILKSLSKEPERRYPTVEQFSEDVRRFLDGMPVAARPATFTYRASKFYRRNKIPVLASVMIFLSLLAGITVALWQAQSARAQAMIAADARNQAEADAKRAEKISQFMSKVISYANPAWYAEGAKFGGEARVINVMDDMSGKIDTELAGQPDIQAELHHKFAEVYGFHGKDSNPQRAERARERTLYHARRAIELRKQFYGERHELVAKDMYYLLVAGGVAEDDQAKFMAEAIQMMRETNPDNLNLPYMLEDYTVRLMLPGREKYHEKYWQEAIPPTSENKYQLAERYLLESLPIFRRHYKEDNIAIFQNECKLAYAQAMQHKFAESEPHYRICKESAAKLQNETHAKGIRNYVSEIEEIFAANNINFGN